MVACAAASGLSLHCPRGPRPSLAHRATNSGDTAARLEAATGHVDKTKPTTGSESRCPVGRKGELFRVKGKHCMSKSYTGLDQHQREFIKLVEENARRHRKHDVFRDFCEMMALALSNVVDLRQYEKREARYMEIVKKYDKEEVHRFPVMREHLVESLEGGMRDCLGQMFMALELGEDRKGQFFTPYEVSLMMAKMTLSDVEAVIAKNGFFTLQEPACGAGGMVIAAAQALQDQGLNYQQAMHVTAIDIDETAVHMSYIQFSLLHIPAVVIHGNALWPEKTRGHWVTPAHVMGFWDGKLRRVEREDVPHPVEVPRLPEPAPVVRQPVELVTEIVEKKIEQAEQMSLFG
ncbi:SAM-dependent DNA methyltransferase [Herbaspirillum sp. HC18]|nr:SAM-dependent DNA methyltransferase [Herbaspirillum sp. HC18]